MLLIRVTCPILTLIELIPRTGIRRCALEKITLTFVINLFERPTKDIGTKLG
jgi:hypothetical protein